MVKKGLMERLNSDEVVIGDGGFVFALEKRGYVKAGPWTPEAVVESPEAVKQLHREFLRAGSTVMQTFTFYASEDKLDNRGNECAAKYGVKEINDAACRLAREVANEGDALVAGGISQTPAYLSGLGKEKVQAEFKKQVDSFVANKVDFLIAEYFEHVEEIEWAIEALKKFSGGMAVCANMCIGEEGDMHGVSAGECAVRMAKAGADVVGINCHFGPVEVMRGIRKMKEALDKEGIKVHLMTQPLGFHTPDAKAQGFIDLPEFPFGLEPRICTRFDMHAYARDAYELGVRYIGGCCGFEPYHIRALTQELQEERGVIPEGSKKHLPWGSSLELHTKPWVRARANRPYWENLKPASGRPFSSSMSNPDQWGVTAGHKALKQHSEKTTKDETGGLKNYTS
ncbi:betaine--homocysteine S-methyltransferase 1-like [Clytia hemisphaerica]|uniref:Hcy-binding domain-containing protein n=1 Tax=Clytia hemisphaerica TaxID=252671 RepID=A0A7M5X6G3_9CNID|eukprot:TCONS_00056924-protein